MIKVTDEMIKVARGTWIAFGKCDDYGDWKAALEAVFDMVEKDSEKKYYGHVDKQGNHTFPHEEPQDNDGWIEWREGHCPDLPLETEIEAKVYNGEIVRNLVGYAKDYFEWRNIIAYRVIPQETKEEAEKEKIPTFVEFIAKNIILQYRADGITPTQMIELISEYLEKHMKAKD